MVIRVWQRTTCERDDEELNLRLNNIILWYKILFIIIITIFNSYTTIL